MESKINPGNLQSYTDLLKLANVVTEDIEKAIAEWEANPPEDDYKTILEAEIVEID